jgi:ompA family protein
MSKGVKRIKIIKGAYNPKTEVLGEKITVNFDQNNKEILFLVSEWFEHTTPKEKQGQVRWFVQNENRTILKKEVLPSSSPFHFTIEKKLCGNYLFYVEASLSDRRDLKNNTGVYIQGKCQAKIVSSKWARESEGKSIKNNKKQDYICYGHPVFLHLETEGLNNHNLTIEIWNNRHFPFEDEKIYSYSNVIVKDGRVILAILDTFNWKSRVNGAELDVEEFFIKVKDNATEKYIKDDRGDELHAIFLNVKNKIVSTKAEPPKSITPSKVGELDKNKESYHSCRFKDIIVKDNDEYFTVFKDGKTSSKKVPAEKTVKNNVYFDFDKSDIRSDAKNILNDILDFLLFNQHLEMALTGHADDRGSLDYNQALSERRAKAVKDFFVSGGLDPNRIKISGKGESEPAAKGNTEEAYQKNRHVEIDFRYFEYNQDALIYETIAGNSLKQKKLEIKIGEWSDKACFRKPKHQKNTVIVKKIGQVVATKKESQFSQLVFAKHKDFPSNYFYLLVDFLNPLAKIYTSEAYHINSCAYFANPNKATLEVRTYPDVVWIGHGKYDYDDDYFFHDHSFELQKGLSPEFEELIDKICKYTSINIIDYISKQFLLDYIKSEAKKLEIGLHAIYNREIEKKGTALSLKGKTFDLIKDTKYVRYATSVAMFGFVLLQIVLEVIILILTRGKSGITKIKKINKLQKGAKKMMKMIDQMPDGIDLVYPSLAYRSGLYYQKQADGKLALILEADIKIEPLIAVEYRKEFDLLDYITDKTIKDKFKGKNKKQKEKDFEKVRDKVKGTYEEQLNNVTASLTITGGISIETNVKFNFLTNTYSFKKQAGNFYDESKGVVAFGRYVKIKGKVEARIFAENIFFGCKISHFEGKLNFDLSSSMGFFQSLRSDENGFFVENYLSFSGIKITLLAKAKFIIIHYTIFDFDISDEKDQAKEYEILPEKRIRMFKIYLIKK